MCLQVVAYSLHPTSPGEVVFGGLLGTAISSHQYEKSSDLASMCHRDLNIPSSQPVFSSEILSVASLTWNELLLAPPSKITIHEAEKARHSSTGRGLLNCVSSVSSFYMSKFSISALYFYIYQNVSIQAFQYPSLKHKGPYILIYWIKRDFQRAFPVPRVAFMCIAWLQFCL